MKLLKNKTLHRLSIAVFTSFFLSACSKNSELAVETPDPNAATPYINGFFIIAEGSYGQTAGTIQYYAYGADTIATNVYEKENPGKITSNAAKTSTLQFASLYNKKLYIASKINGPILKLDAGSLKEEARYHQEASNWRSLMGVREDKGLISANDGVYSIDLTTLQIQYKLSSVSAVNSGDMLKDGDYVYILQSNGAKIISAANYSFIKGFSNITRGFAKTANGKVWAAAGSRLIAIDKNLDTTGVTLPVSVGSFGLDAPTRLTASTKENAVFYHSGTNIYKYIDGDAGSLSRPFITIDVSPFMVYGAIRYDSNKDYIVVNGIQGYGAASGVNYLLIYNAGTGALVKNIKYGNDGSVVDFSHIWFPGLAVFH